MPLPQSITKCKGISTSNGIVRSPEVQNERTYSLVEFFERMNHVKSMHIYGRRIDAYLWSIQNKNRDSFQFWKSTLFPLQDFKNFFSWRHKNTVVSHRPKYSWPLLDQGQTSWTIPSCHQGSWMEHGLWPRKFWKRAFLWSPFWQELCSVCIWVCHWPLIRCPCDNKSTSSFPKNHFHKGRAKTLLNHFEVCVGNLASMVLEQDSEDLLQFVSANKSDLVWWCSDFMSSSILARAHRGNREREMQGYKRFEFGAEIVYEKGCGLSCNHFVLCFEAVFDARRIVYLVFGK